MNTPQLLRDILQLLQNIQENLKGLETSVSRLLENIETPNDEPAEQNTRITEQKLARTLIKKFYPKDEFYIEGEPRRREMFNAGIQITRKHGKKRLRGTLQALIDEKAPIQLIQAIKESAKREQNKILLVTVSYTTFLIEPEAVFDREQAAVYTFLEVIDHIDIESVKRLNLLNVGNNRKHNAPLITTERIECKYKIQWDSICGKYLVGAHGNAEAKAKKLREISDEIDDIEMKIEVESPDGTRKPY